MSRKIPSALTPAHAVVLVCLTLAVAAGAVAGDSAVAALPNPLKHVQPGQWVVYRIQTLFGELIQKQTVLDVAGQGDERTFTIKTEMSVDDEVMDERTDTVTYERALEEQEEALKQAGNVDIAARKISFKGRDIDAVEVSFTDGEGQKCRLYLSENVPLVGVIRMEIEGQEEPSMELVDFGS